MKKLIAIFILSFLASFGLAKNISAQGQKVSINDGSDKFAFQYIKAGTSLTRGFVGDAKTIVKKGKPTILGDKVEVIKDDISVGDLAKKSGVSVDQILLDNFGIWIPDPKGAGFSSLYVKINENETIEIPFLDAVMDASLGGLVVHWGGGEDKWFKAYNHGSLQSSTDTKHKINKSAEGEHNLVLVKSKVKDSEGIIDVNVSGISPKTGKQRHIGYVFNISNSSLKPTLGLQGTQYEFLSSEKK